MRLDCFAQFSLGWVCIWWERERSNFVSAKDKIFLNKGRLTSNLFVLFYVNAILVQTWMVRPNQCRSTCVCALLRCSLVERELKGCLRHHLQTRGNLLLLKRSCLHWYLIVSKLVNNNVNFGGQNTGGRGGSAFSFITTVLVIILCYNMAEKTAEILSAQVPEPDTCRAVRSACGWWTKAFSVSSAKIMI